MTARTDKSTVHGLLPADGAPGSLEAGHTLVHVQQT